jgi:penicillin-binding protein 2
MKTGIESSYESQLHGDSGFRHIVTNARGRHVPAESRDLQDTLLTDAHPTPGANLYLSIDLELQKLATELLADRRGAVVAMDPWSGEVLTLVSAPSFDPNLFAVGMSTSQFSALQQDLDRPLFNRAVRGSYPPGSTIKPMLALAALETGATNLERKSVCHGFFMLPNTTHRYRDWKPEGHGEAFIFTRSATISASIGCMTTWTASAWAERPVSTSPARGRASCPARNGSAGRSAIVPTSAGSRARLLLRRSGRVIC